MTTTLTIELISASVCNRCTSAKSRLVALILKMDDNRIQYREIDVLEQLDYAVSLGVLSTPSIAINGELVFSSMPSLKRFEEELNKRLDRL